MDKTAETVYTPDGKLHVLLGSVTLESIVREYAGDDAANMVREVMEENDQLKEEKYDAESCDHH